MMGSFCEMELNVMAAIMKETRGHKITESLDKIAPGIEMDRLSPFFSRFALSARVFYSGKLCGESGTHESQNTGHLHVLRHGTLQLIQANRRPMLIREPSVLLFPRPRRHRFWADETSGAEIVCASVEFGAGMLNPLAEALPDVLVVPSNP
jgi:hypothetical protein